MQRGFRAGKGLPLLTLGAVLDNFGQEGLLWGEVCTEAYREPCWEELLSVATDEWKVSVVG